MEKCAVLEKERSLTSLDEEAVADFCESVLPDTFRYITSPGGMCYIELDRESSLVHFGYSEHLLFSCLYEDSHPSAVNGRQELGGKHHICCDADQCNKIQCQKLLSTLVNLTQPSPAAPEAPPASPAPNYLLIALCSLGLLTLLLLVVFLIYKIYRFHETTRASMMERGGECSSVGTVGSGNDSSSADRRQHALQPLCRSIANEIILYDNVGHGRFGSVYRGRWQSECVAVKKFNAKDIESFHVEQRIYTCCAMTNRHILHFFAADAITVDEEMEWWLITEFCELGSLQMFLIRNTVELATCLKLCFGLASGLAFLHKEIIGVHGKPAIAHRDLKSSNILVKAAGHCVIGDFGQAICCRAYPVLELFDPSAISVFVGTKRYMAPEILDQQINKQDFNAFRMADVYAVGLIFWEIARRTEIEGHCFEYDPPYADLLGRSCSTASFRRIICEQNRRPPLSEFWGFSKTMIGLAHVMSECWRARPDQRLTAYSVKKRIMTLMREESGGVFAP